MTTFLACGCVLSSSISLGVCISFAAAINLGSLRFFDDNGLHNRCDSAGSGTMVSASPENCTAISAKIATLVASPLIDTNSPSLAS